MKNAFQSVKNTLKGSKKGKMSKFVDEDSNPKANHSVNFQVHDLEENFNCRICQDIGEPNQEVCIPCECAGSIKYVHVNCLKEWMKQKQSLECEICHKPYKNKWKIWAYENKIVKSPNDGDNAVAKDSVWMKLVPMIIFSFFFYSLVVFLLNTKVPHHHNKYHVLVLIFRAIVYIIVIFCAIFSWRFLKNQESFEEKEQAAIAELKKKIARFIRD